MFCSQTPSASFPEWVTGSEQGKSSGRIATFSLWTGIFRDDISSTEDSLQKTAHKLNEIITEYGLTVSVQKTKWMAFKGRDTVRTEIVIDNKIIERVNSFNCLGNVIYYGGELDIDSKLNSFLKITGILNNVFRPQKKP